MARALPMPHPKETTLPMSHNPETNAALKAAALLGSPPRRMMAPAIEAKPTVATIAAATTGTWNGRSKA